MKEGVHPKNPSHSVHFDELPDDEEQSGSASTAQSPDGRGQSESMSDVGGGGAGDDATSRKNEEESGEDSNSKEAKPTKIRARQFSEPSNAFKRGDFNSSQKSLNRDLRRVRQDSVSSAGFGSSHFGSSSKRKGSMSSANRVNFVTDSVSIVPTLSVEHIPKLNELYPRHFSLTNQDGLELEDLGLNGDVNEPENAAGTLSGDTEENKWAAKLTYINEQSEPLNRNGKPPLDDDMEKMTLEEEEEFKKKEARKYMKNLLVLCLGFFFVFTAFLSLRNLQSSLNAKDGLGLYALSVTYAFFFLGCIMATTIVQRLGPKRAIVLATTGPFLYVLANFYPLFYTLIPAAASAGFCQGVIWTAHATYIANIAASYSVLTNEKIQNVLSRFNGIFFVFYQTCQIIGGMISSIVLKSPEEPLYALHMNSSMWNATTWNETMFGNETLPYVHYTNVTLVRDYSHCGKGYCPYTSGLKGAAPVDRVLVYILVGIFTGCIVTGMLILALWLDQLEGSMKKTQASVGKQLVAVFKFYCNRHAICMVGFMFYSLLQAAFMFGEYTKAFVTCTLGIHMVGFVMMTLSTSSAIAAFVNGRIQQWTTRPPLVATGFIFQIMVLITLLIWTPTPADKAVFFILVVFWGMGDGIIMTQDISIIGFLFSHNKEPAFAALKMTQSIANFSFFMVAPYLCTVQKIAFVMTVCVIAATGYTSLEVMLSCEQKRDSKKALEELREADKEPIKT